MRTFKVNDITGNCHSGFAFKPGPVQTPKKPVFNLRPIPPLVLPGQSKPHEAKCKSNLDGQKQ